MSDSSTQADTTADANTVPGDGENSRDKLADTAATMTRRSTKQAFETIQQGIRGFAHANRPVLTMAQEQGQQFANATRELTGACHGASAGALEDVQAMTASLAQMYCSMQEWSDACAGMVARSTERLIRAQESVMDCRTPGDLVRAQQRYYQETIGAMRRSGARAVQR